MAKGDAGSAVGSMPGGIRMPGPRQNPAGSHFGSGQMPGMGGSVGVMGGPGGGPTSNPAFQYGQTPSGWTNPGISGGGSFSQGNMGPNPELLMKLFGQGQGGINPPGQMSGNTMHQPGQIPGNPMQKFGQGSMGFRNPNEGGMLEGPGGFKKWIGGTPGLPGMMY